MKHLIPVIAVSVHRDITTTVSLQVPAYEIPILESVHGEDNVYPGEPTGDQTQIDAGNEYNRMCDKYGEDRIRDAYGVTAKGDIRRAVEKSSQGEVEDDQHGIHLEGPDSKPGVKKAAPAAPVTEVPSSQWSKAQLVEHADINGISVDPAATKAAILATIEAAQAFA